MRGPPPGVAISLDRRRREELERVVRKETAGQRDVRRATIILLAGAGWRSAAIASEIGCCVNTVRLWRGRFAEGGTEGLKDAPRSGRPLTYGERERTFVKSVACSLPEARALPLSRLSLSDVHREAVRFLERSPSRSTIGKWLKDDAIKPWRYRSWITPRDPDFMKKAGPVLDLYHRRWKGDALEDDEIVLCGDEKPAIQSLRRIVKTLPAGPGQPVRVEHEYERKGVLVYQTILNTGTGKVIGQSVPSNTAEAFRKLVDKVMGREPYRSSSRVFLILDNGSAHLPTTFPAWLAEHHKNVVAVFLPVHASWLNQAEIYNSITQRKVFTPIDSTGLFELETRIKYFEKMYNETAHPFDWKFSRKDLRALLKKLGPRDS